MGGGGAGNPTPPPPWVMVVVVSHHHHTRATAAAPAYLFAPRGPASRFYWRRGFYARAYTLYRELRLARDDRALSEI